MLEYLECLAKYGFIDIFFGIGIMTMLATYIRRIVPSKCPVLHVDPSVGDSVSIPRVNGLLPSLKICIRNSGQTNVYIARAYFRPKRRIWWLLGLYQVRTGIRVHPLAFRIAEKDAFELKVQGSREGFTNYEALVPPGDSSRAAVTWLPLAEPVEQGQIDQRQCGVLYIEYGTRGKQGVHRVAI